MRQSNATQRRNRLLAAHQAARIHDENADENADYSDANRRVAELNARINNEIGIELGYSGIDIVLGNIEPLEDEIDSFHQIPVDYYRTPGHLLLCQKVTKFLPSFHVPCVVHRCEEPSRLLKPCENRPAVGTVVWWGRTLRNHNNNIPAVMRTGCNNNRMVVILMLPLVVVLRPRTFPC